MPPRCAKCAMPWELPNTPSTSSSAPYRVTSSQAGIWNGRNQQQHASVRKGHAIEEQQSEDAARGPEGRIGRGIDVLHHPQLSQRRSDHADEVVQRKSPRAEQQLDVRTEDVQREHVAGDMPEAFVQEGIGDELPGLEGHARKPRAVERPERKKRRQQRRTRQPLQAKDDHISVEYRPHDGRQSAEHCCAFCHQEDLNMHASSTKGTSGLSTLRGAGTLALLTVILTGCLSTSLIERWKDPSFAGPPLHRVLVVGVQRDSGRRRFWESSMVAALARQHIAGTASYEIFPDRAPTADQ